MELTIMGEDKKNKVHQLNFDTPGEKDLMLRGIRSNMRDVERTTMEFGSRKQLKTRAIAFETYSTR